MSTSETDDFAAARSESDYVATPAKPNKAAGKGKAKQKSTTPATKVARVLSTACEETRKSDLDNVDSGVLSRIKKALQLAQHEGTGEPEAKAAMRHAHKLMQGLNITTADVMAQESSESKADRAGKSEVAVCWRNEGSHDACPPAGTWMNQLAWAMNHFFNVKHYNTRDGHRLVYTFYGIAENSVAAVMGFEMVFNLVLVWREQKKGELKGAVALNSYVDGVAQGLLQMAEEEKAAEEKAARDEEKRQMDLREAAEKEERRKQLERLNGPSHDVEEVEELVKQEVSDVSPSHNKEEDFAFHDAFDAASDDDGPFGGDGVDFDEEENEPVMDLDAEMEKAEQKVKIEKEEPSVHPISASPNANVERGGAVLPPMPKEELDEPAASWTSSAQLTLFRNNAASIADDFLKTQNIKIKTSKRKDKRKLDADAYKQGKVDARKIDVKRSRIEG